MSKQFSSFKIDLHHHIFLPQLAQKKKDANKIIGWVSPPNNVPWDIAKSLEAMNKLGIAAAVLSYPADIPQYLVHSPFRVEDEQARASDDLGEADRRRMNRTVVRELNLHAKQLCDTDEESNGGVGRFGWLAALPDLRDTEGALEEIGYALDVLHADGIGLPSSYGSGSEAVYIADDRFDPVWDELNSRGAVVFIHGTQTPSSTPYPHQYLGIPITEVPNETYKAAAHLVVTGKKRRYSQVKIILSHLGGSALALAPRVAALSGHMGCALSAEECIEDFNTFFVDCALSAHRSTLQLAEGTVGRERILYGTDFPAVSVESISWYTRNLEEYYAHDDTSLAQVARETALALFPRFKKLMNKLYNAEENIPPVYLQKIPGIM